ncbi:MAG TPA: uracil-DNA glycosylase [Kofleriaceae bacterium]|nr:uracil-DNA glycosylase [Kofleriaceae bacterium]
MPEIRDSLACIHTEVVACARCPRLVAWREEAAARPPLRFRGQDYWARPVPGFGDARARLLVLGLAPAAHGGNRTGRVFTGDRSGDWLYRALHRAGFASQPTSEHLDDGLRLRDCYVAAAVRCAPPDNRPAIDERDRCMPYLVRELAALARLRVIVALGGFAWDAALRALRGRGVATPSPRPRFGHGAEAAVGAYLLIGSYHPSQQNTFTGRLREADFDAVFARSRAAVEG